MKRNKESKYRIKIIQEWHLTKNYQKTLDKIVLFARPDKSYKNYYKRRKYDIKYLGASYTNLINVMNEFNVEVIQLDKVSINIKDAFKIKGGDNNA